MLPLHDIFCFENLVKLSQVAVS